MPSDETTDEQKTEEKPAEEKNDEPKTAETIVSTPVVEQKDDAPTEAKEDAKEDSEMKTEEEKPKEPEKPKELEEDSPPVSGKKVGPGSVHMDMSTATLNVMPIDGGSVLMTLTDGGLQYLLASVRSTAGIKSGRYLFEIKILEFLNPAEGQWWHGKARAPAPRQLVRVGLSTQDSSIFLSDGPDNVCFDSEGYFIHEKKRKVSQKFGRDQVVGFLLNLDSSSPNANTVSLFRDGVRVSEPQALPENLQGQPLFPTITYRNMTVQLNYGPEPLAQMPFKCHMLQDASASDVQLKEVAKNEKNQVVFPVGLPDTGVFDWVDGFLAKNPSYTELSDRKILEWASKSGLWRQKGYSWRASNDKPEMGFGIPFMDDTSVSRLLTAIAPTLKRNYVVMELKGNLVANDRATALKRFSKFETSAHVLMGEPNQQYKALVQDLLMAEKKKKAEAEKKKKAMEVERKRLAEERQKKAEAAKKARLMSQKKDGDKEEEAKDEEPKEEEKDETPAEEDAPPPELTEEEKNLTCRKLDASDLLPPELAKAFVDFSLPTKEEGFTKVQFDWQEEAASSKILKDYVHEKKATQRIEGLKPGDWFLEKHKAWQETFEEMKKKQKALKPNSQDKDESAQANEELPDITKDEDLHKCDDAGEPIYAHFKLEDWVLLNWRFELHLLVQAFVNDVNDAEHIGVPTEHLGHYFKVYYKRVFQPKDLNCSKLSEVVELMSDTFSIDDNAKRKPLLSKFEKDAQIVAFVKLVEEARRDRLRRIEAGDESARLKLTQPKSSGKAKASGKGKKSGVERAASKMSRPDTREESKNKARSKGEGKAGGKSSRVKMAFQQRTITKRQQERRERQYESRAHRQFDRSDRNDVGKGRKGKSKGSPVDRDLQWSKNVGRFAATNLDRKRPAPAAMERDSQRTSGHRPGKGGNSSYIEDHSQRPSKGGKGSARRFSNPPPRPPAINRTEHQREHVRHQERYQERNQVRSSDRFHERPSRYEERSKGGKGAKTSSRPNSATAFPPRRDEGRPSNFRDEPRTSHRESRQGREKGSGKSGGSRGDSHPHSRQFSPASRENFSKGDRNAGKGDRFGKNDRGKGGPSRNFDRRR